MTDTLRYIVRGMRLDYRTTRGVVASPKRDFLLDHNGFGWTDKPPNRGVVFYWLRLAATNRGASTYGEARRCLHYANIGNRALKGRLP